MADTANAAPCEEPGYRQFDFWLGEWEVRGPGGEVVGRNTISRAVSGCGLREEWRGVRGLLGTSLSTWSPTRGSWHQTWIDSAGTLLLLDGGLQGGSVMVLEGEAPLPGEASTLRHRISWSVVDGDPDHVRQHWETSHGRPSVGDRVRRPLPPIAPAGAGRRAIARFPRRGGAARLLLGWGGSAASCATPPMRCRSATSGCSGWASRHQRWAMRWSAWRSPSPSWRWAAARAIWVSCSPPSPSRASS